MRIVIALFIAVGFAAGCCADPTPGAPPPPPFSGKPNSGSRSLAIGPKDSTGVARLARGNMMLVAVAPADIAASSFQFLADDKSIGTSTSKPFRMEYDMSSLPEGEHVLKAVAKDGEGNELWSAQTKIKVVPAKAKQSGVQSEGKPKPPKDNAKPAKAPRNKRGAPTQSNFTLPSGITLDREYRSADHDVTLQYPGNWTFKDQSVSMKPRNPGDFWITFGQYPIDKAAIVVNVRRVALAKDTTAATFAKYNSYVRDWKEHTAHGCPAFLTTDKSASPKTLTHRMIVIEEGFALMVNCIDATGKPAEETLGLMEAMVASIKLGVREGSE